MAVLIMPFLALPSFEACEDSFDVCVSLSVDNNETVSDLLVSSDNARCAEVSKT